MSRSIIVRTAVVLGLAAAQPALAAFTVLKQTSNPTPVAGGAAFAYTITVTNTGGAPVADVTMIDPLPPGIILANNNIAVVPTAGAAFSCITPPVNQNGTIACHADSVPAGGSAVFTIVVQAIADLSGGVRTNSANVTAAGAAISGSVQTNIQNNANLLVSMKAPQKVPPGEQAVYDLLVKNTGSSSAVNVVVTDPLPSNATFVSAAGTGPFRDACTFDPSIPAVTCNAGFVPTGDHHVNIVLKTAKRPRTGMLDNTVTVTAAVAGGGLSGSPAMTSTMIGK